MVTVDIGVEDGRGVGPAVNVAIDLRAAVVMGVRVVVGSGLTTGSVVAVGVWARIGVGTGSALPPQATRAIKADIESNSQAVRMVLSMGASPTRFSYYPMFPTSSYMRPKNSQTLPGRMLLSTRNSVNQPICLLEYMLVWRVNHQSIGKSIPTDPAKHLTLFWNSR